MYVSILSAMLCNILLYSSFRAKLEHIEWVSHVYDMFFVWMPCIHEDVVVVAASSSSYSSLLYFCCECLLLPPCSIFFVMIMQTNNFSSSFQIYCLFFCFALLCFFLLFSISVLFHVHCVRVYAHLSVLCHFYLNLLLRCFSTHLFRLTLVLTQYYLIFSLSLVVFM